MKKAKVGRVGRFINMFKNLSKQQPTESKKDSYEDIIVWGVDRYTNTSDNNFYRGVYNNNDFPQQLIQDVYNSPIASTALEVWVEFIKGQGFNDEELNNLTINSNGEKLEDLLYKISYDVAHLDGFSVHVSYNAKGEISEIHHQPFEQTRLGLIEQGEVSCIKTNPYYGIPYEYNAKYSKTYYTYNPDREFVLKEMKEHAAKKAQGSIKYDYPGQIFWVSIEKPLARIYPQPSYYSAINYFRADNEIPKFYERNLKNNFFQSHILNVYGDPDELIAGQDKDGNYTRTREQVFNAQLDANARGSEFAGGQLINWYSTEEEKLVPEAFPTNANDNLFSNTLSDTQNAISIATKVPPILLGIQVGGKLGTTQEIINSIKKMQGTVKPKQRFITKNLDKILSPMLGIESNVTIKDTNLVNVYPDWVFDGDSLSRDEKRQFINDNFPIELDLTTPQPQAMYKNESYTDYPESASNNAKRALEWAEKNGWGECGTQVGKQRANQLAKKEPITRDTIARMASFSRHEKNKDVPYTEGCGGLMWDAWGGSSGINWAKNKLKEIDGN